MCIVGGLIRLKIFTLKYSNNNQIKSFINTPFKNGYRTLNSATIIHHIFHNNFINREISTGIVKASVSDLFSISISNRK